MAGALKTTVYLDAADYERIKRIARAQRRAPAELVRQAIGEFVERNATTSTPRSVGAGHSKRGDVAERAEELLEGMGRE